MVISETQITQPKPNQNQNETKMKPLTRKQEMFCQEVLKQDSYSDAYRIAYNATGMSDVVINVKASEMMKRGNITVRVKELKKKVEQMELYTIEKSVKRDLELIERYECALAVLENKQSSKKDVEVAERMLKFIGSHGYNSTQERLAKQHGFYEKDNDQKISLNIPIHKWLSSNNEHSNSETD